MPKSDVSDSESEEHVLPEEQSKLKNGLSSKNEQKLPDYEVQRRNRIEENNKRMEALGLKKISTSLMGSIDKAQKKMIKKKGKKRMIDEDEDEDEEYNPTEDNEEMDSASEEGKDHGDFSKSLKKKVKKNTPTPKKRGPAKKLWIDDYADDDDSDLMQAIALSLKGSAEFLNLDNSSTKQNAISQPSNSVTTSKSPIGTSSQSKKEIAHVQDDSGKQKRKKTSTSRVQMSEDEMLIHFFQFDEIGKGGISVRDIERLAITHDFTWTEKEIADMVHCFDSDGDRKISYDDFRKIVGRCNMLKTSDNNATDGC